MATRARKDEATKKSSARRGTRKGPAAKVTEAGNAPEIISDTHNIEEDNGNTANMSKQSDNQHFPNDITSHHRMETPMNTPKTPGREPATLEREPEDHSLDFLLTPPTRPKEIIRSLHAGAGRGAHMNLDAIAGFNQLSEDRVVAPVFIDPAPGKAIALNREAQRRGIRAGFIEAKAQDVVQAASNEDAAPLVLQLDRATDLAKVLRETEHTKRVTFGYLVARDPRGRLIGLRFVVRPGDTRTRLTLAKFFEELGNVTLARGSSAVVGADALPEHAAIEPLIRAWFAAHLKANISKAVADIEPDADPVEVTFDGEVTQPVVLRESLTWAGPEELAEEVKTSWKGAIARGSSFVIIEWVTGEGLRVYSARLRRTDGNISVQGATVVSPSEFQRADLARAEAAELRRRKAEALAALARAAQMAFTRTNPVATTD
ncbi:MAG: hypothetical protein U0326_06410 [Polyangiales bacterium]